MTLTKSFPSFRMYRRVLPLLSNVVQVFRKQGLATSLINFVKGIAEAHEIELYASCGMVSQETVRGWGGDGGAGAGAQIERTHVACLLLRVEP